MATRTLCQDICYGYNVFFENCICEDCMGKEERKNSNFFENQLIVDTEASSEFKSMDVQENLRPTLDEISGMQTGVSEKTHFHIELQKKEIGKSSNICSSCNKNFTTQKILKRHIKIHSDEVKKHQCSEPGCNFSFTRKDHLNRHMRTHTGEKLFSCTFCKEFFTTKESKVRHTKNKKACAQ